MLCKLRMIRTLLVKNQSQPGIELRPTGTNGVVGAAAGSAEIVASRAGGSCGAGWGGGGKKLYKLPWDLLRVYRGFIPPPPPPAPPPTGAVFVAGAAAGACEVLSGGAR